jgi:hypothetical protein
VVPGHLHRAVQPPAPAFWASVQAPASFGQHHGGAERQERAEAKAERLLRAELKQRGWDARELARRRKGDRQKAKLALRLRQQTTMTWGWIAEKLVMGAAGYAANCVRALSGREGQ